MAAQRAVSSGLRTVIFDSGPVKDRRPQCGEVISRRALRLSGLTDVDGIIVHELESYRVYSPSGDSLAASSPALSIDRSKFEEELIERCMGMGVKIRPKEPVKDIAYTEGSWTISTKEGSSRARAVILAAGPVSPLSYKLGLGLNRELMMGLGARIAGKARGKSMDFFVSADMEGGYGWKFPRGHEMNIGICSRGNANYFFSRLLGKLGIKRDRISSFFGGPIPDGGPVYPLVGRSCVAAGDAGGFCHPVSKGGIHCSMISGVEASKSLISHLSGDDESLSRFDSKIREHPAFSKANVHRRDLLSSLQDDILDTITGITKGRDVFKIGRSGLMIESIKHPNLFPYAKKASSLFYRGLGWIDYTF
jgi:flavin-dependent dehydrogenase